MVKPDVPFRLFTNSGPDHFIVSGTVREENPEHFYLELFKMEGAGQSMSCGRLCDSQEAKLRREEMKAFLGPDYNDDKTTDPSEAGLSFNWINGPGFEISLKKKHGPSSGFKTDGPLLAILDGPVGSSTNSSGLYTSTGVGGPQVRSDPLGTALYGVTGDGGRRSSGTVLDGVRTNQFGFNITGSSNLLVVIEASTNLANPNWYPVQTNTLNGSTLYFTDPQWTNYGSRFYRVTWP